jgi:spermidine synthase|tara:strand:- start:736 stop:1410 length:675 start_codon:yes stop_codon:yes gene_type:complete
LKPRVSLATAKARNGLEVLLYQHDDAFGISIGGKELMHSKVSASEICLGEIGVENLVDGMQAHILIGGLGLGFTLKSVLDHISPLVKVDIFEIIPEIINWNKTFLYNLNGALLDDSRVSVVSADVSDAIFNAEPSCYDVIILDLDNGPVAMVDENNAKLYSYSGIKSINRTLKNNGRLAIWSAGPDLNFENILKAHSVRYCTVKPKVYRGAKRARHLIYVMEKQ